MLELLPTRARAHPWVEVLSLLPSCCQDELCLLPGILRAGRLGLLCRGSSSSRSSPGAGLSPRGQPGLLSARGLAGRQRWLEGGRCELSVYSATSPRGRGEVQHLHTKATERRESEHSRQHPRVLWQQDMGVPPPDKPRHAKQTPGKLRWLHDTARLKLPLPAEHQQC